MTSNKPPNFHTPNDPPRLMQAAVVACLGVTAVMTWALVWGPNSGGRTASIGEQLDATTSPAHPTAETPGPIPKSASDTPTNSTTLDGEVVRYYESQTGRAFSVDLRTLKHELISDKKLPGFVRALWSPLGAEVIGVFDQPPVQSFRYYDYVTDRVQTVGASPVSAAFSPNGRRLAYIDQEDGAAVIYLASPDGTESRKLLAIRVAKPSLSWLNQDSLLLLSQRPDRTGRDLTIVNTDGTIESLMENKENLDYVTSSNGAKMLFSYFSPNDGVQLAVMDVATRAAIPLGLSTSAKKCAFAPNAQSVVCGVPPEDALAQGVEADRTATLDDIVLVNLTSGGQQTIYKARRGTLLSVSEPLVSSLYFAFTNLFDRHLYRFELPR